MEFYLFIQRFLIEVVCSLKFSQCDPKKTEVAKVLTDTLYNIYQGISSYFKRVVVASLIRTELLS